MQQQSRRVSALKHLRLKTVIKESHCSPVQQLAFNTGDVCCRNLFATVARDQATIYSDAHMGEFVAVVASLALSTTPAEAKDAFCAAAWINCSGLTRHPYGDALLAVGGADRHIHIISTAEAAVVAQLPLPEGTSVAELSGAADCPGLLLALCRDGSMQLWQAGSGHCLWRSGASDAYAAALHPSGACIVTSSRSGKLSTWDLLQQPLAAAAGDAAPALAASCGGADKQPLLLDMPPGNAVDCLRFLSGDRLAFKAVDGRMAVIAWPSGKQLSSWRVPGFSSTASSSSSSFSTRCSFGHTADGQIVCVGNPNAAAYVYSAATGSQLARVEAIRVQGPVHACGLSEDCRHLAIVVGAGYVFRFESSMAASVSGMHDDEEEEEGEEGGHDEAERDEEAAAARRGAEGVEQEEQAAAGDSDSGSEGAAMEDEEEQDAADCQLPAAQQLAVPSPALFTPGVAAAVAAAGGAGGGGSGSAGPCWLPQDDDDDPMQQDVGAARELWGSGGQQRLLTRTGQVQQQQQQDDSPLVFRPTPSTARRRT